LGIAHCALCLDDYYPVLVLALDTTTSTGSCALARDGRIVCEQVNDAPNAHAEHLPGDLMSLLERAGTTLSEIDVFAVATGPGSFTGIRIGIATMQGLAFADRKPLVGVSGFDALARIAGDFDWVATWVDAWRGEVFAALYEHGREAEPPVVGRPEVLLESLSEGHPRSGRPTLFIGDGALMHRESIRRVMGESARLADPPAPPLAGTMAILASVESLSGEHLPHAIRPLYIRRTDAELAQDARTLSNKDGRSLR
jgi:tRNA threonylcarbamoyladenosine biosynthesis protein TsaB